MGFVTDLGELLARSELPASEQAATLRALADALERTGTPTVCRIVPFIPGRRPTDEIEHPGLGSSEAVMVALGDPARENRAMLLYEVEGLPDDAVVDATVSLDGLPGEAPAPLAGWERRRLQVDPSLRRQRIEIDADDEVTGHELGFAAGYLRRARVEVRVEQGGRAIAADEATLDVCDIRYLGLLYDRVIERVVAPDMAKQAAAAGVENPGVAYHPWYPVLHIGGDKAALYTRALVDDIVGKKHHLTDPAWLLRVGIYLELLTCIGIAEAVRDDIGDLLEPDEREAFENSPVYAEIRERIDPAAWREVWQLRSVSFPKLGLPRTGPVSATNLLSKRRATLAFLHVHHDDLKHAIELAGPNNRNSQETWQRVFRDAERAVLRQTTSSFPELAYVPAPMRELILWQRRGFADQQGLYATACVQYRASMNAVADWAKAKGLMDHTGADCVPVSASLLEATVSQPTRVAILQRKDGYGPTLELTPLDGELAPTIDEVKAMLAAVAIFAPLSPHEIEELARTARPILLGPTSRLVQHGAEGTSLFVVADGEVEVLLRMDDGTDVFIESMGSGAVVGEMSLLTGAPRSATVRGGHNGALVFEISQETYFPIVRDHPEWVDQLAAEMEDRLARRRKILDKRSEHVGLRERIRHRVFGPG